MDNVSAGYKNFRAAIYLRAQDIVALNGDITPFAERFDLLSSYIKVGKVYVETHRDLAMPDEAVLRTLKNFLTDRGVMASGGITATINEGERFKTYCYSNPKYRQKMIDVVTLTARFFDEIIFDDFFFTSCKCPLCVSEKGERSWTDFRLEQMTQASGELVLAPAKAANPNVKVVIKYPNWYEHFQGLGFNLKDQPPIYDGIYTGNETRDAVMSEQHLQPYEGYLVFRYFENIKPGGNLGGWVDPFGSSTLDRYAEQLWLTLFAKAPEITLFDYHSIQSMIRETQRGAWQGQGTSFSFDGVTASLREPDGSLRKEATMALAAGAALEQADKFLGELGNPIGLKTYKPYHSTGEDFLHNYLGMLGIPLDLVPEFPTEAETLLLTESAKHDSRLVEKIKAQLLNGMTVIITTGLLKALQGKGLQDIVEMECTDRKVTVDSFRIHNCIYNIDRPLLIPIVHYLTNDSWEEITCMCGTTGTPLLHSAEYGRSKLFVLTIPDNFDDLYYLPGEVLNKIRETTVADMYVRLEGPARIALFVYDNDTFIVESFLDMAADIRIILAERYKDIEDIATGESVIGQGVITIKPHSYRVFRAKC